MPNPERARLKDGPAIARVVCGLWQVADLEKDGTPIDPDRGAILGAVVVWGVWALSGSAIAALFPDGQQARAAALQIVLIGVTLCAILLVRPRGLLGEVRTVSRHLTRKP